MYAGDFDLSHPILWTVENMMTPAQCEQLVRFIDKEQPTRATVDTGRPGGEIRDDLRNNRRITLDDATLANNLFLKAGSRIPSRLGGMKVCGINERIRYYMYQPGEYFRLHRDGFFQRNKEEKSLLTFMVYLNGNFEGGETSFPEINETVTPGTGLAVFFQHRALHESVVLRSGAKYVLRSDVMYTTG